MLTMRIRPSIEVIEQLGAGTDAVVFKARSSHTGNNIAIKINKPGQHQFLGNEILILKKLHHPNIVGMINYRVHTTMQPIQIELELELMHESLYNHFAEFHYKHPFPVRENFIDYRLNRKQLGLLCKHIGSALFYLHDTQKILHGDIKSNNIMISRRLNLFKLIDFGNSVRLPKGVGRRFQYVGSDGYMPPECVSDHLDEARDESSDDVVITFACDIYAFGSTLYECITGTNFNETNLPLEMSEMLDHQDRENIYPKIINLINLCIADNPNDRPDASELKAFSFK